MCYIVYYYDFFYHNDGKMVKTAVFPSGLLVSSGIQCCIEYDQLPSCGLRILYTPLALRVKNDLLPGNH